MDLAAQEILASKLAALTDNFAKSLPKRLADLEMALIKCKSNQVSHADFVLLSRLLHTLAGSSGTFGFIGLGQAAGRIDSVLHEFLNCVDQHPSSFDVVAQEIQGLLDWAMLDPKNAPILQSSANSGLPFNPQQPLSEPVAVVIAAPDSHLLYLLDAPSSNESQDSQNNHELIFQLELFGYKVNVFRDLPSAIAAVATLRPSALVVDIGFAGGMPGLVSLQATVEGQIPCVVVANNGRFESRLAAAVANTDGYFIKPVNMVALNASIEALVQQVESEPYRILIVDDDVILSDFHSTVLKSVGMDVYALHEPEKIFQVMAEFKPELLLIDIYMPTCNGLHLAKVIRQEPMYLDVPIVFLSTESNLEKQLAAIQTGADDFLTKPISAHYLVSSLTSRVQRYRALRNLILRDSLTKLFNHSTMKERTTLEIERARRNGQPLSLAMVDLDYFKSVNDNYGHLVGDNVIRSLAQLLQKSLRRVDVIGRYGGEEFAVIFPETTGMVAREVMDKVRASFAKIKHDSNDHQWEFAVTFSGGVVELSENQDTNALFAQADSALYAAKHAGRNRIQLYQPDSDN